MMLTICYLTNRREPMIEWFFDSFHNECGGDYTGIKIVVVDKLAEEAWRREAVAAKQKTEITHVAPKPTVWQGKHRLTKDEYFAASNARNTGVCLAPDGWIVYVDDLSVLTPGWLARVRAGTADPQRILCGAYRKVNKLVVAQGKIVSCVHSAEDSRRQYTHGPRYENCPASWLFGCSVAAPVEAILSVNGWPEYCDGMGYEDVIMGPVLARRGYNFTYDTEMLTVESDELHFIEKPLKRWDKGTSPNDKSHDAIRRFGNIDWFENYFGPERLRGLRARVLAGEPFPVCPIPEHDWFDSQPLREM